MSNVKQKENEPLLTPPQAARYLQVSLKTLYNYRLAGLPCLKFRRAVRFRKAALDGWIESHVQG